MASLPSQHPHLALHLADRALTPLISSSSSSSSPLAATTTTTVASSSKRRHPAFSTSPPSSDEDEDDEDDDQDIPFPEQEDETLQALNQLTTAALASYDAAKRLDRGAPLRTMVEYPGPDGPIVLHSYMCPTSLALGIPGRKSSSESLRTAVAVASGSGSGYGTTTSAEEGENGSSSRGGGGKQSAAERARTIRSRRREEDEDEDDDDDGDDNHHDNDHEEEGSEGKSAHDSPQAPPMLISTVIAPKAEDLRDARRAAGRLERVARVFQSEWIVAGSGGGSTT